jgi:hypothetical protein
VALAIRALGDLGLPFAGTVMRGPQDVLLVSAVRAAVVALGRPAAANELSPSAKTPVATTAPTSLRFHGVLIQHNPIRPLAQHNCA